MSTDNKRLIYWKEYDEPIKYFDPILKKEMQSTGTYICEDERVEKFWMYGTSSINPSNSGILLYSSMLFKKPNEDGTISRWESEPVVVSTDPDNAQQATENLIHQAEQYLKSLP